MPMAKLREQLDRVWSSVDDLVLVHDEGHPRSHWKLGKVEQILTSKDGQNRGADVKENESLEKAPTYRIQNKYSAEGILYIQEWRNLLRSGHKTSNSQHEIRIAFSFVERINYNLFFCL